MTNSNTRSEIVINRMFAGGFLSDHIGHEIVNMYKDDKGRNYIYIQPYGTYERSHHNCIEYVLMVRNIPGKRALEVLGLATGLHEIFDPSLPADKQWKVHEQYIRKQEIAYGGVSLLDIFDRSKENADKQPVYITMEAERVMRPNRKVYVIYGNKDTICDRNAVTVILPHTNQAKCSLKQYFHLGHDDYDVLKQLVTTADLWTVDTEPIQDVGNQQIYEDNFFDILGVSDYELAFSNALRYYVEKYPELAIDFLDRKLGTNMKSPLTCLREWNNIDLLIEDDDEIVVIENKITSKVNGIIVKDGKLVATQLKKYHDIANRKAQGEYLDDDDPQKNMLKLHSKRVTSFILTPDYNPIEMDDYNTDGFICKDHYRQLFYSEVYSFLKGHHPEDWYFQEFVKGMEKHTKKYHNDLFDDTKTKFIRQIQKNTDR